MRSLPIVCLLTGFFAGPLAFGTTASAEGAISETCAAALETAHISKADIPALATALDDARRNCPAARAAQVAEALGFAYFNEALERDGVDRRERLTRAAALTRDWRVQATLGGDLLAAGYRADAVAAFDLALLDLQDDPAGSPSPETVRKIITMSNNARATAETYVKLPRTRSGAPGGASAERIGAVEIESVPFPVEFEFGSDMPTEDGAFAIEDLARLLAKSDASAYVLAGHTDPVGSDAANLALSKRRAEAVRDALIRYGAASAGDMAVVGCGKRSEPAIEGREFYTEAEIHQIMRRVELVRSGEPCP